MIHTYYQGFSHLFERILACYKLHFSSGRYEKYHFEGIHIALLRAGDIVVIFVAVGVIDKGTPVTAPVRRYVLVLLSM